jgi:hypothetical protein
MTNDAILTMDPFILLSWANTKLRDEFHSLEDLCYDYDLSYEDISFKLQDIGYSYCEANNQFKRI